MCFTPGPLKLKRFAKTALILRAWVCNYITYYMGCNYLTMPWSQIKYVSKGGFGCFFYVWSYSSSVEMVMMISSRANFSPNLKSWANKACSWILRTYISQHLNSSISSPIVFVHLIQKWTNMKNKSNWQLDFLFIVHQDSKIMFRPSRSEWNTFKIWYAIHTQKKLKT